MPNKIIFLDQEKISTNKNKWFQEKISYMLYKRHVTKINKLLLKIYNMPYELSSKSMEIMKNKVINKFINIPQQYKYPHII